MITRLEFVAHLAQTLQFLEISLICPLISLVVLDLTPMHAILILIIVAIVVESQTSAIAAISRKP